MDGCHVAHPTAIDGKEKKIFRAFRDIEREREQQRRVSVESATWRPFAESPN